MSTAQKPVPAVPHSRRSLIKRIETLRDSRVICLLTSLRPNVPAQIAEDQVRVLFDHLLKLPSRPVERLDLFLCSNGGSGTVPWRMVSLLREFAKSFCVLLPYRAYSAASLLAMGADEIVMHPFAEMGPIDPTVTNQFNPENSQGQKLGISVEDVTAYVHFIKDTVGITHEDELVEAIKILADKVHPLALGNVERFIAQSRMIAKKILGTHLEPYDNHTITEIVENMASKLYFHGHPINRLEAKTELRLKVNTDLQPELETALWDLYVLFEEEFKNREPFDPVTALVAKAAQNPGQPCSETFDVVHALIESEPLTSRFVSRTRFDLVGVPPAQQVHPTGLGQGWDEQPGQIAEKRSEEP